jgi:hypothetical protein
VIRTFARRAAAAAVPLITLPVLALAAAPGTAFASAPDVTINIQSQAQLLADGHVVVTVGYTCNPASGGSAGSIFVRVAQPGRIGATSSSAVCDDHQHTVNLDVGPGPFTPGSASAIGQIFNFNSNAVTTAELKVS